MMSLEGALPPEHSASPALTPPGASLEVTVSLLHQFYTHVKPLEQHFPASCHLLREGDSDAFKQLVQETMVAGLAEEGIGELRVEATGGSDVGMRDILEQVHTRIFAQHARAVVKARKIPGAYISVTPKNVLAMGYRPATGWNNDAVSTAAGAVPLVNVFANTTVSALRSSREWHTLLSRTGPHPLLTLFASPTVALFAPLANACFLQISGTPVSELKPRYLLEEELKRGQKRPRKRSSRVGKRKRREADLDDSNQPTEDREATVEATPPPSPPSLAIRTPNQSPIKRLRTLGPSISAPELLSPRRPLAPLRSLVFPPTQAVDKTTLRPTQSSASILGGVKRGAELESGAKDVKRKKLETLWSPNEIVFSRHRLYHARPAKLTARKLAYGLPPKHIFTRISDLFPNASSAPISSSPSNQAPARHLAKYIFPRQFGLHNVFTAPKVQNSFELLPDYDDRELDIKKLGPVKTPKRLKQVLSLLEKLLKLHSRCNPRKLLDRHCPSKTKQNPQLTSQDRSSFLDLMSQPRTQMSRAEASIDVSHNSLVVAHGGDEAEAQVKAKPRFVEYTCSPYEVESYIQSIIREVVPRALWGSKANGDLVLGYISSFLRLRRYESMTVHTFLQKFCIADCAWLLPASASQSRNSEQRPNEVEMAKRKELLQEFLFWIVDGLVIPLVRTAFYITDSATHQNRPLFFRQDDWERLCAPLLGSLGKTIFERIPAEVVNDVLRGRQLGFSYVRLLPKATGVRPIVNLARRPLVVGPTGRREVGKTINKILQSTFDVLTFERKRKPELVGSLVASPQEIYARLKTFKQSLPLDGKGNLPKLYFVKVDVRAAYDTIKQEKLLKIVEAVLTENDYWVQRYAQVTPALAKADKKFKRRACRDEDLGLFSNLAAGLAEGLHNALLSDQVVYLSANRDEVMSLLREHITTNLVKIGPRLFRQKDGIPQGSVLSSLLCSLFYGDMELHKLGFTKDKESLLLRYVDDFLFVSTQKPLASRFLRVMDEGHPDYGCYISTEKRLTSFDIALRPDEIVVPLSEGESFPWCGLAINTQTLDVMASMATHLETEISDKLTVQRHKKPGQSFINTMLRAIKLRSHVIYSDTSHNSLFTVYLNIYQTVLVVALKFQAYVREWGADPRKRPSFFLRAIKDIVKYTFAQAQTRSQTKGARELAAECDVKRPWVLWLGFHAFHRVLSRKPAVYAAVLYSLAEELRKPMGRSMSEQLSKVVKAEENKFVEKASVRKARRFL